MKINRLETHDRLEHFQKHQSANVFRGAEECMKNNSLSLQLQEKSDYIYLFAHPRTDDDGINKRLLWQPRLSKPKPQENSYLFRAMSKTDCIEICWIIPPKELWGQYSKGKVTESNFVDWSIHQFKFNRQLLETPHPKDVSEEHGARILQSVINEHRQKIRETKPKILVGS